MTFTFVCAADDTSDDGLVCWFYAVDSKSRDPDNPKRPSDPVFSELRAALLQVVHGDQRKVMGLDGKPTRYMDLKMPIKAIEMLASLRHNHDKVCKREDIARHAHMFAFDDPKHGELLVKMFHNLGMLLHFPNVSGCEDLIILEPQWLVNALATLIREEELHGSVLDELIGELGKSQSGGELYYVTNGHVWHPNDVKRGLFSVPLLNHIWGHKTKFGGIGATKEQLNGLKALLKHFYLIYPISGEDEEFFVVPALAPSPPPLSNSELAGIEPLKEFPTGMIRPLRQMKKKHGDNNVKVLDFKLDFSRQKFLPKEWFERLLCAVATKISESLGQNDVKFYHGEGTFSFDKRYIHTKLHLREFYIQVYCIDCGASDLRACQYSLRTFLQCALEIFSNGEEYDVRLRCPLKDEQSPVYHGIDSQDRNVHEIWFNGRSFVSSCAHWWNKSNNKQFTGIMQDADFTSCAKEIAADIVPQLLKQVLQDLLHVSHAGDDEEIRNWDDQILVDADTGDNPSHIAMNDAFFVSQALSGRLDEFTASDWKSSFVKIERQPLIDILIPGVFDMCEKIHRNKITCSRLGSMVENFLKCVEAVSKYYQNVASSSNMGASVARLNKQADTLLPSFRRKVEAKVLRKEVQHWAIAVIQVWPLSACMFVSTRHTKTKEYLTQPFNT